MDTSILLSILCATAWGTQSVFLKKAIKNIPLSAAILISLAANFVALIFLIFIGVGQGVSAFLDIPTLIFLYFMLAGFFNYLLGRGFYYSSFRFISMTQATAISSSYPIISVAFALVVLGEKLSVLQFIGIGLTVAGVYLLLMKGGKKGK
jgi:drug/metabolite transporter (DMT)-like permease